MKRTRSQELLKRAIPLIPGGVNSPVRAYRSVGGDPPFIARAEGATLMDEIEGKVRERAGLTGAGAAPAEAAEAE